METPDSSASPEEAAPETNPKNKRKRKKKKKKKKKKQPKAKGSSPAEPLIDEISELDT